MNAVEIEEQVSALAELPFDRAEFPYAFLEAFGNKSTMIKRLRSGTSNKSDRDGLLQANNIHLKTCGEAEVSSTLASLKASPATIKSKAKFVLATDGMELEAEDMITGETIACDYKDFSDHFGFFLPLAGISTVKQIRESSFDIKATGHLNRLYVELLKDNPEWGTAERRHDMNHFMARLIFCFFAEDTDIFKNPDQFTGTIERMSEKDSSNTHEVISELFRAMNTKDEDRTTAGIEPLLKWVRRLLDDGKINSKTEWLHVLMMLPPVNSVLLTALQRRLREILGNNITVSYDSSSPFQNSGISQKIAVLPELTDHIKTWSIKSVPYPQHPKYKTKTDIRYLDDNQSPITKLISINEFHAKHGAMETKFLDTLAQHLLTNYNVYVYHKAAVDACDRVFGKLEHEQKVVKSIFLNDLENIAVMLR